MRTQRHYRAREKNHEARENRINLRYNDSEFAAVLRKANKMGVPVTSYAAATLLAVARDKNIL